MEKEHQKPRSQRIRFFLFMGVGFGLFVYFFPAEGSANDDWYHIGLALFKGFLFSFTFFYLAYWVSSYIDAKLGK